MATLQTYDLKGLKLSFANWISNISPVDTPFVSMTGKESVDQVKYQWQVDRLAKPTNNAVAEGSVAAVVALTSTEVLENYTQIMRKAVRVTNSAKATGLYGRSNEVAYQMEKAGAELKRDVEYTFLNQLAGTLSTTNKVRKTSGFRALVGTGAAVGGTDPNNYKILGHTADPDTGAVVVKETTAEGTLAEADIFDITQNLYLAGSKADTIMVHPEHMTVFSKMVADGASRQRMFKDLEDKYNMHVRSIKDPLGQTFQIVPNRFMPKTAVYFFNAKDWTQMVFRAPERTKLSVTGSNEKWMIEMEVGLRHRNPYASGVLLIKGVDTANDLKDAASIAALTEDKLDYACFAYGVDYENSPGASKAEKQKAALKVLFSATRVATLDEQKAEAPVKATRAKKA